MKIERIIAILNLLTRYMKLHDVVTQVFYFCSVTDEDNNRKNDGRELGRK
jgi:hypothetical protein